MIAVNSAVNHGVARSDAFARVVQGDATTVIEDGHYLPRALRRLALRPSELDHAVRMQNGDDISEIETGRLEPDGQLVLTLKETEQSATKADVAQLRRELTSIQASLTSLLAAPPAR